jgi:hypothetical protein
MEGHNRTCLSLRWAGLDDELSRFDSSKRAGIRCRTLSKGYSVFS